MPETITLYVNGEPVAVAEGCMVSAAVMIAGTSTFRRSVTGEPRGPLCGMGICFECRVTIDGELHARSCQTPCRQGMDVRTDG
ncbi:MAG TPA: (2Fe-2S)-binding protein [Blastocatellia bacterium]|nr:(2Fe-2S)-binding protein [Blastocatellia bacterium]